jgi:hypothetical protein
MIRLEIRVERSGYRQMPADQSFYFSVSGKNVPPRH